MQPITKALSVGGQGGLIVGIILIYYNIQDIKEELKQIHMFQLEMIERIAVSESKLSRHNKIIERLKDECCLR